MTLYKVTDTDGRACNGGRGVWREGVWRSVRGPLVPCQHGLHLCREQDLVTWLGPVIWEAETRGEVIEAQDKVVARRARVVRRLDTWTERTARLFAADCAEHVLPIFERARPDDDRPRRAIKATRRNANGQATDEELAAAGAAARDAAGAAAWDAARAAAWAAAWDAAGAAAWAAAGAAAWDAAWAAEREWQTARLMAYLRGEA